MPKKPIPRGTKWIGTTPAVAVCTGCGQEFKVPLASLKRMADAQAYLQQQFEWHKCPSEETAEQE